MKKFYLSDKNLATLFLIPSLFLVLMFNMYPIIYVFVISFQNRGIFDQTSTFIGFYNYLSIFRDPNFLTSLKNSLIWTAGTTSLEIIYGTLIALLLNRKFRYRNVARGLLLIPYVIPIVVSTMIWRYVFNDLNGLVNYFLQIIGIIDNPINFFAKPGLAMLVVISINVWTFSPFVIINMLAAMQGINTDLYDAAKVDGANNFQIFKSITIPSVAPVLIIVALLRAVWNFQKFDVIYMMTRGGPLFFTTTTPIMIFREAFGAYNFGRSAAMAVIVFIILIILAVYYIRFFEKIEKRITE